MQVSGTSFNAAASSEASEYGGFQTNTFQEVPQTSVTGIKNFKNDASRQDFSQATGARYSWNPIAEPYQEVNEFLFLYVCNRMTD